MIRGLATIAACYDTAAELADRGDIERDDIEDTARLIGYRVLTAADRLARAPHTWWHADRVSGDADTAAPPPDRHTRVRAETRQVRTRRGVSVNMVTVHGRAYVGGSTRGLPSAACSMSAAALAHAIDTAPWTDNGMSDAVSLTRLTDIAYPDIPRLIGGDVLAFHEHAAYDETRAATPIRGWHTRYRLPTIRPRSGELARAACGELLAPHTDPARVWIGHRLVDRSATVRDQRATRARANDDSVTIRTADDLAAVLTALADTVPRVPYRIAWTYGDQRGVLAVSGSDRRTRYAVSGLPVAVSGHRTAAALGRAVARAQ